MSGGGHGGGLGWVGHGHGAIVAFVGRRRARRQILAATEAELVERGLPIPPNPTMRWHIRQALLRIGELIRRKPPSDTDSSNG